MRRASLWALILATSIAAGAVMPSYAHADDFSVTFDFNSAPEVAVAPPPLPVYDVPEPPDDGYVWMPGQWRWDGYDYFWVPGTWVQPPEPQLYWTPGYWDWQEGYFVWHEGYWGPQVGYYGGIAYGGGYNGTGFVGGGWNNGVYVVNRTYINVTTYSLVGDRFTSFHGGPGGTTLMPTDAQRAFEHAHHVPPTRQQIEHAEQAGRDPALRDSANHGRPDIAVSEHPGDFAHDVRQAQRAGAANAAAEQHNESVRANPALAHGAAVTGGRGEDNTQRSQPQAQPQPHTEAMPQQQTTPPNHPAIMRQIPAEQQTRPVARPEAPAAEMQQRPVMQQPHPVEAPQAMQHHEQAPAAMQHPPEARPAEEHRPEPAHDQPHEQHDEHDHP